jgi:hypothetical protein
MNFFVDNTVVLCRVERVLKYKNLCFYPDALQQK